MRDLVQIPNPAGLVLRGVLHRPSEQQIAQAGTAGADGQIPLVVMYHGFCDDKDEINFVFVELSQRLEEAGIASARFDFAGSGSSDGKFEDMTISGEVNDALAILDWARSLTWVDEDRIGVHGLSMGGAVSSMVAGLRPDQVKCLSMWCPAPDVAYNMRDHMTLCGIDASDIREKGYVDVEGLKVGLGFYEDCLTLDPFAIASAYPGPVNTVHGDADTTASCACSQRYKEIFGDRCNYLVVHGAEHRFKSVDFRRARMESAMEFLTTHLASQGNTNR